MKARSAALICIPCLLLQGCWTTMTKENPLYGDCSAYHDRGRSSSQDSDFATVVSARAQRCFSAGDKKISLARDRALADCKGTGAQDCVVYAENKKVVLSPTIKDRDIDWGSTMTLLTVGMAGAIAYDAAKSGVPATSFASQQSFDEQTVAYNLRQVQIADAHAQEQVRQQQWLATQSAQHLAQQQAQAQPQLPLPSTTNPGGQRRADQTRAGASPAPSVRVQLTHDQSRGGPDGRVGYVNIYATNLGTVPIDCDVWLKGAFWNERAGRGMPPDQALSSITTQRRTVIGLKPGQRTRALALTHHVAGSRFDYDSSCRVSFTY